MSKTTKTFVLAIIILFSAITRLYRLNVPTTYYFDEVYHAFTAKAYAKNDPRGYEWWHSSEEKGTAYEWLHPPISKLFMGASIRLFGENSFAWRLPSALFGILVIYLTYLLSFQITKKYTTSLLAAFIASLDGLLLTGSRIAMNDIYVTAFILLTVIFYTKWIQNKNKKYLLLTGIFTGLSISTKWSGVFVIGAIGLVEGFQLARKSVKFSIKRYLRLFVSLICIPLLIYFLSFTQFFLQGHSIDQFIELHNQIFWYQFNLEATHPYQSKAWQWPLLIKPVWMHVDYSVQGKVGNIYAMSNPLISWFGLISVLWYIFNIFSKKKYQHSTYYLLLTTYLIVWLPWIFSPRIMFYYHYMPAIPFLVIILAIWLRSLYKKSAIGQSFAINILCLITITFFLFYPHWTGIPMNNAYNTFINWLPTWK